MSTTQAKKKVKEDLQQANSVYDLQSTEEAIKWMHAVCIYTVKSTWIKDIKACNYIEWTMMNERNVTKYYLETTETPKGHLNQLRTNVRSTKPKHPPPSRCPVQQHYEDSRYTTYTPEYTK